MSVPQLINLEGVPLANSKLYTIADLVLLLPQVIEQLSTDPIPLFPDVPLGSELRLKDTSRVYKLIIMAIRFGRRSRDNGRTFKLGRQWNCGPAGSRRPAVS